MLVSACVEPRLSVQHSIRHKKDYHMARTAPRALSLQKYWENPRMRAVRISVSRAGKKPYDPITRNTYCLVRVARGLGARTALRSVRYAMTSGQIFPVRPSHSVNKYIVRDLAREMRTKKMKFVPEFTCFLEEGKLQSLNGSCPCVVHLELLLQLTHSYGLKCRAILSTILKLGQTNLKLLEKKPWKQSRTKESHSELRMRADNGGRVFCSSGLIDFNMM